MSNDIPPDVESVLRRLDVAVKWDTTGCIEEVIHAIDPPSILLRPRATRAERRWAIWHGLAHLALHRGNQLFLLRRGDGVLVRKQERQAEEWAASVLVPGSELVQAIHDGMTIDELADHFDIPADRVEFAIGLLGRSSIGVVA